MNSPVTTITIQQHNIKVSIDEINGMTGEALTKMFIRVMIGLTFAKSTVMEALISVYDEYEEEIALMEQEDRDNTKKHMENENQKVVMGL